MLRRNDLLIMFAVHVFLISGSNQFSMHGVTTVPMIMGVFAIINGLHLNKIPAFVRLWPSGIEIGTAPEPSPTTAIPWNQISRVQIKEVVGGHGKTICLFGPDEKVIAEIAGPLCEFTSMTKVIQDQVQASTGRIAPTKPDQVHRKRGRWTAIGLGVMGLLTLVGCGALISDGRWQSYRDQAMASESVIGTGIVTKRKVAPNGMTKRVFVEVTGDNGSSEVHNFETTDAFYQSVAVGDQVSVQTVPADPRIAKLSDGQIQESSAMDSPIISYLMALVMGLASTLLLTLSVIAWKGLEMKFDQGRPKLVPIGES